MKIKQLPPAAHLAEAQQVRIAAERLHYGEFAC